MTAQVSNPLVRTLKGVILILLVGLVLEAIWFGMVVSQGNGAAPGKSVYSAEPPAIVPMAGRDAFEESVERALFSWNRRPNVTEQPVDEIGLPSKWHLTGVVNTGTATYAIFSDESGSQRLRLEEGMYLEKWKLESITAEQVTLSDGEETEVFYLRDSGQEQKVLSNKARKEAEEDEND